MITLGNFSLLYIILHNLYFIILIRLLNLKILKTIFNYKLFYIQTFRHDKHVFKN